MQSKKIKILWDDKNLMVMDKPAGVAVHGDGLREEETISDYIIKNYKKLKGVGEDLMAGSGVLVERPGIVHRLDKDTSGCLIICKNQNTFKNLKEQFQQHKIRKEYLAVVWGYIPYETGLIDLPIARSKNDFRKKQVVRTISQVTGGANVETAGVKTTWRGEERSAVTRYKVIKRAEVFGCKLSLVSFYPETGRTHQIRVHAKSMGHPIVADNLYGPRNEASATLLEKIFKSKNESKYRHLLHAKSISFTNPENGEILKVESPIPKEFSFIAK